MKKTITALVAACALSAALPAAASAPAQLLAFYPQAGTIGPDLYVTNFVDLQDGPGVKDFGCGGHSYDGHTGIDSIIRSFREVRIGVPVFAALDGRVLSVQQGSAATSTGARPSPTSTTTSFSTTAASSSPSTGILQARASRSRRASGSRPGRRSG